MVLIFFSLFSCLSFIFAAVSSFVHCQWPLSWAPSFISLSRGRGKSPESHSEVCILWPPYMSFIMMMCSNNYLYKTILLSFLLFSFFFFSFYQNEGVLNSWHILCFSLSTIPHGGGAGKGISQPHNGFTRFTHEWKWIEDWLALICFI